jgi:hypothetical protein
MRDIFQQLRRLPTNGRGEADFETPEGADLAALAASADTAVRAIHLGLGALGQLVARSSTDIADGSVPPESMANLGFLMSELGDLAAECMWISAQCRSVSVATTEAVHASGT